LNQNSPLFEPRMSALHSDTYQLTMLYGYWKQGRHEDPAVFDLFFRKAPFGRTFAVFGGLSEVLQYLAGFKFTEQEVEFCQGILPDAEPGFFQFLRELDCSKLKVYAIAEGSLVFPRVPLIRVEGPLGIAQYIETALLNLVNFPTLVATNAARFRLAAGPNVSLSEFGLRRAQGPDGGLTASKYAYLGGFDSTSNMRAGQLYGIPVVGTHAHAFVQSFTGIEDLQTTRLALPESSETVDFVGMVLAIREELGFNNSNEGELAAFIAYAQAFPTKFLALVDSYDTLASGVPNFMCVAEALARLGYKPIGVRLDSGDLAYLSKQVRRMYGDLTNKYNTNTSDWQIVASNDITESVLLEMNRKGHEVNTFGIGTHLVTCLDQPALGAVYKLVRVNSIDRIKLSEDPGKITIPGRKWAYRLLDSNLVAITDVMLGDNEAEPQVGHPFYCRHPFDQYKQMRVVPGMVLSLHLLVWDGEFSWRPYLGACRERMSQQISNMRDDMLRGLNPTPYKVSVSAYLFDKLHVLIAREKTVPVIR